MRRFKNFCLFGWYGYKAVWFAMTSQYAKWERALKKAISYKD